MLNVSVPSTYQIPTPMAVLAPHLHKAFTNIAPEQINAFQQEYQDLHFDVLDDQRWIARVDVAAKRIQVSIKVAEVLWSAALAYLLVYQEVQQTTGGITITPAADSDLRHALDLLSWALSSIQPNDGSRPDVGGWPQRCQRPSQQSSHRSGHRQPVHSDEQVADELMLCMLAFVLHHELAHIRLRHQHQGIDLEREADQAASDWILGRIDRDSSFYYKRVLGITARLILAAGRSTHDREYGGTTHPRTFDRLFQILDRHLHDSPDHVAWYFAAANLALHISNTDSRLMTPPEESMNGKDAVNRMIDLLAQDQRRLQT